MLFKKIGDGVVTVTIFTFKCNCWKVKVFTLFTYTICPPRSVPYEKVRMNESSVAMYKNSHIVFSFYFIKVVYFLQITRKALCICFPSSFIYEFMWLFSIFFFSC